MGGFFNKRGVGKEVQPKKTEDQRRGNELTHNGTQA